MFILIVVAIAITEEQRHLVLPAKVDASMMFTLENCAEAGRKELARLAELGIYAQATCLNIDNLTIE